MSAIKIGDRVRITVPAWIYSAQREYVGRVIDLDPDDRVRIDTSSGLFHPKYVDIRVIPSHRADGNVDPLEGLTEGWLRAHANAAAFAVAHPIVVDVMDEYAHNMRFHPTDGLPAYGMHKVAQYAAQVARAQALDINPERLTRPPVTAIFHDSRSAS